MKHWSLYLIAFLFGLATAGMSFAESTSSDEAILKAWLSSPHANSKSEAFRHWDTETKIPGTCAVCHSTTGVVDYLANPISKAGIIDHEVAIGTSVECAACHNDGAKKLESVLFPSDISITATDQSAICSVCHQGRASSNQVTKSVADFKDDEVSKDISFINIHYAAAASTQLGSKVSGGFQYEGLEYAGPFGHAPTANTCVACHGPHTTKVEVQQCTACHQGVTDFRAIRTTSLDVLGNGDKTAGIAIVIDELHSRLRAAIMAYAADVAKDAIVYSDASYPYFFKDTDGNGVAEEAEAVFPNRYQSWTPRLLKAAYNYQFVKKDGGAFAHNPHYVIQLMIDSINDLSKATDIDTSNLNRPK